MPTYKEIVDSREPGAVGFSYDGARASMVLKVSSFDVIPSLEDLLGSVKPAGDGSLNRRLPKAHPRFPWLYAERISNCQGIGAPSVATSALLDAPTFDQYAVYPEYLLTVEFTSRPYAVLSDSQVTVTPNTAWTDVTAAGAADAKTYAKTTEMYRFVDMEWAPAADFITAQHGNMVFKSTASPPDGVTFSGRPSLAIQKAILKLTWHMVPGSYVVGPDSHVLKYLARINQHSFMGFDPGMLLYVAVGLRRYTPPYATAHVDPTFGSGVVTPIRYWDVQFVMEFTRRPRATNPYADAGKPASINANWIADGHNLMPWYRDRRFYYVTANNMVESGQVPTYLSVPFHLLFTDPTI
jgi:hypothetical protein